MQKGEKGTFVMRIVAGFICAFVLLLGAPCHAADDTPSTVKKSTARNKSAAKEKSPVKAKEKYTISLTPTVGEYFFANKDKLKNSQIYAVKLSYNIIGTQMLDSLGIDAIAGYIDTTSKIDNSKTKVYHFRVDTTYPFIFKNSNFTPFLAVGAGANFYERSDASDRKALFGYGGGLKYKLLDYLAVRADVRHIILFTPERDENVELTAGLTYTFGVERKPKPPADSDNDGVPDTIDKCPGTPKGVKVDKNGCPVDSDGDGVPDYLDKCPGTPKGVKVDKNGCPESQTAIPESVAPAEDGKAVKKGEPAAPSVTAKALAPQPAAVPTEGGAAMPSTTAIGKEAAVGKAPEVGKKTDGRNIAKPVEAVKPSASAAPQTAAVDKAKAAPAAQKHSAPVPPAPATAPVEAAPAPAATREVSPESKIVPPAAPAGTKVTVPAPAGETSREITTPAAVAPSAPVAPAPAKAAPEPAVAREVSPGRTTVPSSVPAEPKVAATTPASEAARETTTPVAVAPSTPVPPATATTLVEAAPAPVEKKAAKVAVEPIVPAEMAPPEKKRQLPEQAGKVSPETPTSVPTGEAALTAIAGTGDGIEILTSAPVAHFRYFQLTKPARLVIDLPGASNGTGKKTFSLGRFGLAGARVAVWRGKLRIVLDAEGRTFPQFRVEKSATGLRVALVEAAPPAQQAAPAEMKQEYLLRFTIVFDTAKVVIRPKYDAMMRKAAEFLLSNPDTVAEIRGHTDSIGKARYNVLLSQRRAGSVRKFFVKKYGVDGSRIIVRGLGYYFPIADNATEAGRQKNRRTEVTIAITKGGVTPKPGTDGERAPAPAGGEPR
jgi:outer membrane protein OmpA-like peptidoglycan-associated protein